MKTLLAYLFVAATAVPAMAGPDFSTRNPHPRPLAASPGTSEIGPLDDVIFAHDSTVLDDASTAQIVSTARWLRRHRGHSIVLEGYADYTGTTEYNEELAARRASIVRQVLLAHGVRQDAVVTVVYGERKARPENASADRRVIMYTTERPIREIVDHSLDQRHALSVKWTAAGTYFSEHVGMNRPTGAIAISSR